MASEKFRIKQIPKESRKQEIWSRRAYVDWVNEKLKAHYTNALEFRNGAMYIQLFDSMFPGVISMDDVKFSANMEYDCYQNFRILEEGFKRLSIDKHIDTHALSSGRHVESWAFLKWFKLFYDINFDGKEYDPVKARKNAYMGFGKNTKAKKIETPVMQRKKRNGLTLPYARSKSVVFTKELVKAKGENNGKDFKKLEKTCRSAECIYPEMGSELNGRITPPQPIRKYENERLYDKVKQKQYKPLIKNKEEIQINSSKSATSSINSATDTEKSEAEEISNDLVVIRKGHSQGDFEPKFAKNIDGEHSTPTQGLNINSIVVNKSQTYEEFGVRITENILIRVENTGNNDSSETCEKRRKINSMIEKFLKYQWIERKEYFQTLAEFLKEENKHTTK